MYYKIGIQIQKYYINGNFIKTFNSINEAAEEVKRKPLTIRDGCYHKKLVAGFQWNTSESALSCRFHSYFTLLRHSP